MPITLVSENVQFNVPMNDRYGLDVEAEIDVFASDFQIEGYEISNVWNLSKDRWATPEELALISEYKEEIGNRVDWQHIYWDLVDNPDYCESENDCYD